MRYLLVVNPASGGGRSSRRLHRALAFFHAQGDEVVVHRTRGPGDGAAAVRRTQGRFDAVIAAGGDGTLHEVIEALADSSIPLGILPWGTGNVFAREMGLPRGTEALCRLIRRGHWRTLDLGSVDGRPFLMMASAGLDAFALGAMAGRLKRTWGLVAYVWAGMGAFLRYPHPEIEVTFDGGRDRGGFVLVSNTRLYGAFFVFHPQADPTDGLLDLFVFRHSTRWQFLGMVAQMVAGTLVGRPPGFLRRHGVYRTRALTLSSPRPVSAQADGEVLPGGMTEVSVRPRALRVLLD